MKASLLEKLKQELKEPAAADASMKTEDTKTEGSTPVPSSSTSSGDKPTSTSDSTTHALPAIKVENAIID